MSEQYIVDRLLVLTHAGGVDKAIPWLMAAADKSHPDALYLLGHIYENGLDGGTPSLRKAKEHYKKAASLGFAAARWKLSHLNKRKKKDKQLDEIEDRRFVPDVFKNSKKGGIKIFYDNDKPETKRETKKGDAQPKKFIKFKNEKPKIKIPDIFKPYKAESKDEDKPIAKPEKKDRKALYEDSYDPLSSAERFTIHTLEEAATSEQRINTLTGMQKVKEQLALVQKRMEFDAMRKDHGFITKPASNHFVFKGNPGTGKTEIARIMGQFFHEQKIVSKGHVVEVERADIVGAYIGKTAHYTRQAIEEAVGGVLFVDEAHSLYQRSSWDFGGEAISTILKGMEDHRDDLIVIMAGYSDEMDAMLKSNPGLKSRIRHQILFPDYKPDELMGIFEKFCGEENYVLHPDARTRLLKILERAVTMLDKQFGNGRFARNVYEAAIENMARRVVQGGQKEKSALQNILFTDIPGLDNLPGIDKKKLKTLAENIHDLRDRD